MKITAAFKGSGAAFSLVEVTLAMGIAVFALVPIIALLPIGFGSVSDSEGDIDSITVLSGIIADRRTTPISQESTVFKIPALSQAGALPDFGISEEGKYVDPASIATARYRVKAFVYPPSAGSPEPMIVHFRVSWPAADPNATKAVETTVAFPQS